LGTTVIRYGAVRGVICWNKDGELFGGRGRMRNARWGSNAGWGGGTWGTGGAILMRRSRFLGRAGESRN